MPAERTAANERLVAGDRSDFHLSPAPPQGRQRMPLGQRAKIFMPFDPLEGFSAALRAVELEVEAQRHAALADPDVVDEIFED